jgi:hypothetical protein
MHSEVQTKEACNKDDNDHYADDVENIHCTLRLRYARFQYEKRDAWLVLPGAVSARQIIREMSRDWPCDISPRAGGRFLGRVAAIWRASVRLR